MYSEIRENYILVSSGINGTNFILHYSYTGLGNTGKHSNRQNKADFNRLQQMALESQCNNC
ncbi:MAG: hypothetical protein AMDU1_APLC00035G0007 [Thermoplasmatales archaeon A-plasma]|nr:MAG: hypothetical protein AMDU1_APLC00035G0007 [Thermoplasmatales archaeon A-plasma]